MQTKSTPLILVLLLSSFCLMFACTETMPTPPYTTPQFINRSTDLNYQQFIAGDYNGKVIGVDGNRLTVFDFNGGSGGGGGSLIDTNLSTYGVFKTDTNSLVNLGGIGIGTTTPSNYLDLNFNNSNYGKGITISNTNGGANAYATLNLYTDGGDTHRGIWLKNSSTQTAYGGSHAMVFAQVNTDPISFTTNNALTPRLYIDGTNARVGINTITPDAKLTIGTPGTTFTNMGITTDSRIAIVNGSGDRNSLLLESAGTHGVIQAYNYGAGAYLPVIINPAGTSNVGIGTTTPKNILNVIGDTNTVGRYFASIGTALLPAYSFSSDPNTGMYGSGGDDLSFATAGLIRMFINNAGTATFVTAGSTFLTINASSLGIGGLNGTTGSTLGVQNTGGVTTRITEIIKGVSSQTADLTQWQNSAGTVLAGVTSAGKGMFTMNSTGTAITTGTPALEIANLDTTVGNYATLSFTDVLGSPSSGLLGVKVTDHTNNYGQFEWWVRGATGTGVIQNISTSGVSIGNGTTAARTKLDVVETANSTPAGTFSVTNSGTAITNITGFNIVNTSATTGNYGGFLFSDTVGGNSSGSIGLQYTDRTNHYGDLVLATRGVAGYSTKIRALSDGNVGIGTDTPIAKLDVNGDIKTASNFNVKGLKGIDRNEIIIKSVDLIGLVYTTCYNNILGGIIVDSNC